MARSTSDRRRSVKDGELAEDRVADWLVARGWSVLARRWRGGGGELDLVVTRGGALRFVEVKLRAADDPAGLEVFTPAKMARVRQAGEAWLAGWSGPVSECAVMAALVSHRDGDGGDWTIEVIDDAA